MIWIFRYDIYKKMTSTIADEYKAFKHKCSDINLMTDYNKDYHFYCKKGVFVIFTEYCGNDYGKIHPIHYDYCYGGNEEFNQWLDRHNLAFEWYDMCVGIVFNKK